MSNPKLSPVSRHLFLLYLLWLHLNEHLPRLHFTRAIPPVRFALLASLAMFALLPALPRHPLILPAAFGAGLSFALIVTSVRPIIKFQSIN